MSSVVLPSSPETRLVEAGGAEMSWYQLASSLCVLLLHLGLQLVEAGSVRSRSVASVMMRGLTSLTLTIITTWMCGYCFAFSPGGPILGTDPGYLVLTSVPSTSLPHFLLYCSLASLPSAILSGSMSERTHLTGHLVISLLLSTIIFPAPAHWLWTSEGWLAAGGCEDQGGPLTLHLLSGCAALLGAVIVGPRLERMGDNFREVSLPGHSLPLTGTGAFLVILGMLGKVVGLSTSQQPHISAQLVVNCLVAGAGGCLLTMTLFKLKTRRTKKYNLTTSSTQHSVTSLGANRKWSYLTAFNGFFTGMICVTGTGPDLPSWAAFLAGITGGLVFFLISGLLRLNKVDDPVHGIGVHCSGGVVGTFLVGLSNLVVTRDGMSVAWQVVGLVSVAAWSSACLLLLLLPLLLCGKLRVKDSQEKAGIDEAKMKEPAYMIPSSGGRKEEGGNYGGAGPHYLDRSQPCTFLQPSPRSSYNLSQLECPGLSPRLVSSQSRPTSSSTMKRDQSCPLPPPPELTITSCDSQAPLLTNTFKLNSKEMQELRQTLLKQRKNLRSTNSVFSVEDTAAAHEESPSLCSNCSVRSSVVRQVENLASNKENFNYLTGNHNQEGNDDYTEIENKQDNASKTQDVTNSIDTTAGDSNGEVKVTENLI